MKRALKKGWLNHVSSDIIPFPRDVGIPIEKPWRRKAHTRKEYIDLVTSYLNVSDLYVSLFSDWQIKHRSFNKVFLDFDSGRLSVSHKEAIEVAEYVKDQYDNYPRVYFSARKGFHDILDFDSIVFRNYSETVHEFVSGISTELKLKTLDSQPIGDMSRVTRIPYTINQKANRLCIPINLDWSLKEILWESKNCEFKSEIKIEVLSVLSSELREIDENVNEKTFSVSTFNFSGNHDEFEEDLKLLLKVAESGLDDFRNRLIHFMINPRMVSLGYSDEEILDFCRQFILKSSPNERKSLHAYLRGAEANLRRAREGIQLPWGWEAFLIHYPEFGKYLEGVKG